MPFFSILRGTLTSIAFYQHIPLLLTFRQSLWFALKSYLIGVILVLFGVGIGSYVVGNKLVQQYPDNLEFVYTSETLTVSGAELPYRTPGIDNKFILLHDQHLEYFEQGQLEFSIPYTELYPNNPSFTMNKSVLMEYGPGIAPTAVLFAGFVVLFSIAVFRIPTILFYSLVYKFFLELLKQVLPYRIVLQVALHATVAAELMSLLYLAVYRSTRFPMYQVALLLIMIVVFRSRRRQIVRSG